MRLRHDPIFGLINQKKILQADKNIKSHRLKETTQYKEAMESYDKKLKLPIEDLDIELRKEERKVAEVEQLVSQMGNVVNKHKLFKPAALASHRQFDMSSRVNPYEIPMKQPQKESMKIPIKQQPALGKMTLDMSKMRKQREKDITIDDSTFGDHKISGRATFRLNEPLKTTKMPNGHYLQT